MAILRLCITVTVLEFGIILGNYTTKTKNFGTKFPVYFWYKSKCQKSVDGPKTYGIIFRIFGQILAFLLLIEALFLTYFQDLVNLGHFIDKKVSKNNRQF